jgi:hypothetical protein
MISLYALFIYFQFKILGFGQDMVAKDWLSIIYLNKNKFKSRLFAGFALMPA